MRMDGAWTMDDCGEFVLREPYATRLAGAKAAATAGWARSLFAYLGPMCPYTEAELAAEMERRAAEDGMTSMEILDEFVIEALSGDLLPGEGRMP